MKNLQKYFTGLLILFLTISTVVAVYVVRQRQVIESKAGNLPVERLQLEQNYQKEILALVTLPPSSVTTVTQSAMMMHHSAAVEYKIKHMPSDPGYGQIPPGYDSPGAKIVLEYSAQSRPGTTIVFCYPEVQDLVVTEVCQFLFKNGWVSMSQEDMPRAMDLTCAPNCQFWNAQMLKNYTEQSIKNVMDHENVHNDQANNDLELPWHVSGYLDANGNRHQQPINMAYQSVIEGHAEAVGKQVGNPTYSRFRIFYARFKAWTEGNNLLANFMQAAGGDWDLFLILIEQYQQSTGKSLEVLLRESGWE